MPMAFVTFVSSKPAAASKALHSASVRSSPPKRDSMAMSMFFVGEGSSPGGTTASPLK